MNQVTKSALDSPVLRSTELRIPMLRLAPRVAVVLATTLLLTGCSNFVPQDVGLGSTPGETQAGSVDDSDSAAGSSESGSNEGDTAVASAAPDAPSGDSVSSEKTEPGESENVAVGTIEVLMDERLFHYDASSCMISQEEVFVIGEGTEASTGALATVGVFTEPSELMHERTGTWQGSGLAVVTVGNEEFVSDGRMEKVGPSSLPAMLSYRIDGNSIEYVLAWYSGETKVRAGYVKATCY